MTNDAANNVKNKKPNRAVRFLRFVFVHNWGLKLTALVAAAVLWLITVGL